MAVESRRADVIHPTKILLKSLITNVIGYYFQILFPNYSLCIKMFTCSLYYKYALQYACFV